jgi:hypothetical protein
VCGGSRAGEEIKVTRHDLGGGGGKSAFSSLTSRAMSGSRGDHAFNYLGRMKDFSLDLQERYIQLSRSNLTALVALEGGGLDDGWYSRGTSKGVEISSKKQGHSHFHVTRGRCMLPMPPSNLQVDIEPLEALQLLFKSWSSNDADWETQLKVVDPTCIRMRTLASCDILRSSLLEDERLLICWAAFALPTAFISDRDFVFTDFFSMTTCPFVGKLKRLVSSSGCFRMAQAFL